MFLNNPLLKKLKKKLHNTSPKVEGIVKCTKRNFGFLDVDSKTSYFITPNDMKQVMNGDRISAQIKLDKSREIAIPKKLIVPFLNIFVGKIYTKNNQLFISPYYPVLKELILCYININCTHDFKSGDWVTAKLVQHKLNGYPYFYAKILQFIIEGNNLLAPWRVTLFRHNLEYNEPNILFISNSTNCDSFPRKDLTHLDFITIDNINTKDIDDALFIEQKSKDFINLFVAIADPTYYIPYNSEIDKLACRRGFTNYLPGFNIPMLPRILSEEVCSLQPNIVKPSLVCLIVMDKYGNILDEKINFFLAWIKSKEKLIYENISNWLEKKGSWQPKNKNIANQISLLHNFFKIRKIWRKKYSFVSKERLEYKFNISENGEIVNIIPQIRNIGHKIVEEAMIVANTCAAKILSNNLGFGIYNTHTGFEYANAENVVSLLINYGIYVSAKKIVTLEGFCNLHRILNKLSNNYLNSRIRRLQSFVEISLKPAPHFGLGVESYATWTSPIRKYGDMMNHRFLKSIIQNTKVSKPTSMLTSKISDCRRLHRIATRDVEDWLYTIFLSNIKKDNSIIFNAEIFDISRGGMRAYLIENGAKVFIPASFIHINRNELICDPEQGTVYIMGNIVYRISDIIQVKLEEIIIESRNILVRPIL
ncbi:exoribonuclease II [Buchnera aphidicola (Formosaphis micheliae)]|uniref:exoribonuclease II n=1 Tax=Buchnera aphidicola TaxID=9 RepID=UPI0031CCBA1B